MCLTHHLAISTAREAITALLAQERIWNLVLLVHTVMLPICIMWYSVRIALR